LDKAGGRIAVVSSLHVAVRAQHVVVLKAVLKADGEGGRVELRAVDLKAAKERQS
jgi:hypothetical protein